MSDINATAADIRNIAAASRRDGRGVTAQYLEAFAEGVETGRIIVDDRGARQSTPEMSTLASKVLQMQPAALHASVAPHSYNLLLDRAKSLAGSVLSQDETPGQG